MKIADIKASAFAMPFANPSFPRGPYRFIDREYLIITYRTDAAKLRELVPEPLEVPEPLVKYEFIRMPDSSGFGNYCESGQVIPVSFKGESGSYVHSMYLNDEAPIAGGREIWGFPKKLASPTLSVATDTLVGTLDYGPVRVATGTMGYKYKALDASTVASSMQAPGYLLKIIPSPQCQPQICELVRYQQLDVRVKGAWSGPAALDLRPHALAPVSDLPVFEIVSATHLVCDLTLGLGQSVFDYLK